MRGPGEEEDAPGCLDDAPGPLGFEAPEEENVGFGFATRDAAGDIGAAAVESSHATGGREGLGFAPACVPEAP